MSAPKEAAVAAALAAHAWVEHPALPGRTNHRRAGVLVPLRWRASAAVIEVLVTERAAHLRHHGGEYSFPGGKPEAGDASLEATALREAQEEIGLAGARVLGRLSSLPLYTSDYRLEPFVAAVPTEVALVPEPGEVASIAALDVGELLRRPHWPGIPYKRKSLPRLSPVFELAPGDWRRGVVYGGTAHALHELLGVLAPLFGRKLPPIEEAEFGWSDVLPGRA